MEGEKKQQKVKSSVKQPIAEVELGALKTILEHLEKHDADIEQLKKANDHNYLELERRIADDLLRLTKAEQTIGKLAAESDKICGVIEKLNAEVKSNETDRLRGMQNNAIVSESHYAQIEMLSKEINRICDAEDRIQSLWIALLGTWIFLIIIAVGYNFYCK